MDSNTLIHGDSEDTLDDQNRFLQIRTDEGRVWLYVEDLANAITTPLDAAEALALIRALAEAVADIS